MRYLCLNTIVRLFFASQLIILTGVLGAPAARADDVPTAQPSLWSVGVTVGTLGLGGEASYLLHDYVVARVNASYMQMSCDGIAGAYGSTCHHNYDVTGTFAGGLLDIHPFRSGWRLSTGVRYVDVEFKEVTSKSIQLGDHVYNPDQVGTTTISVRNTNPAAPYIGFGYDASHYSQDGAGFKLGIDLGALYAGDPDVTVTTTHTVPGLGADIAKEIAKTQGDLKAYYNFYPVAMISGRVSF